MGRIRGETSLVNQATCLRRRLETWKWERRNRMTWLIAAVTTLYLVTCEAQDASSSECRSVTTKSCSQCIQSAHCAWCADPAYPGDFRCDAPDSFTHPCSPQYQYQDLSHFRITENVTAGTYEPKYGKIRQFEPQQVHVFIKPGDTVTFPLKYYHAVPEEKDIYVLNSDTQVQGVTLAYAMNCKGSNEKGQLCRNVRNMETVLYNVSISIRDCNSNAVISIGITAIREVVALYVQPQCGCDCERPERQERRSGHCSGQGTLSCGVCQCDDARKGGRRCECDLQNGMTSDEMESRCRESPDKSLCSGHGYCACGVCVCNPSHLFSGKYCECENVVCALANGLQCNGHGQCACGKCQCDSGWSGTLCDCSPETHSCLAHDGTHCSGHGTCQCNKCKCQDGYEGDLCEEKKDPVTEPPVPEPEPPVTPVSEEETSATATATDTVPVSEESTDPEHTTGPAPEQPSSEQSSEQPNGSGMSRYCSQWFLVHSVVVVLVRGFHT